MHSPGSGQTRLPLSEPDRLADASISLNTRRAYLGALARLDAWRGTAPVDDASLAVYLGTIFEAGRPKVSVGRGLLEAEHAE